MAGLGGLPYYIQDMGALQQQQAQRQQMEFARQQQAQQAFQFQQSQEAARRQQMAQQAAGQALPQLLAPPPAQQAQIPPPQPPMPGQASQPMVQPGQMPPPPQGGAPAPQGPPPPYRALPTSPPPQGQQAPGMVPPPPSQAAPGAPPAQQQPGPWSLERAVQTLQSQGLEGADLMAGLSQLTPLLDAHAKTQAAAIQQQFTQAVQLEKLGQARETLEERKREADQRSEDRKLDREARQQAAADSRALRMQLAQIKIGQAGAGGDLGKLDKETVDLMADQFLASRDASIFTNLGRGAQGAQNVIAIRKAVAQKAKEQGITGADLEAVGAQYQGEKAAARTAGTKAANVELAAAEAQKTIGIARQLSSELPRTEFVPANRALQAWQSNTGDPKVVAFGAALNTVVNAYARAISPSGTPTVSDKEHARQMLSTANTKGQFDAVMKVMEQEMSAAREAPKEVKASQRARISGRPEGGTAPPPIPAGWTVKER